MMHLSQVFPPYNVGTYFHRLKRLPFLAFTSTSEVSGLTGSLAGGTVLELTGVGQRGVLGGLRL